MGHVTGVKNHKAGSVSKHVGSAPQRMSSLGLQQLGLGWGPAALGQTPPHPFSLHGKGVRGGDIDAIEPDGSMAGTGTATVSTTCLFIRCFSFVHRPDATGSLQCGCGLALGHST